MAYTMLLLWPNTRATTGALVLPVRMSGGQQECELHNQLSIIQLVMLQTVQLIRNVRSPHIYLNATLHIYYVLHKQPL